MFASKRVDKCCFSGSKTTRVQHFAIRSPSPTYPLLRYFLLFGAQKARKAPHLAPHRATPPSALPERDGPSLRARVASRGGAAPPARVPGAGPSGAPRSVPSRRRRRDDRDARRRDARGSPLSARSARSAQTRSALSALRVKPKTTPTHPTHPSARTSGACLSWTCTRCSPWTRRRPRRGSTRAGNGCRRRCTPTSPARTPKPPPRS